MFYQQTEDDIAIMNNNNEDVSIATIYRNLNILAEEGKIKKVYESK